MEAWHVVNILGGEPLLCPSTMRPRGIEGLHSVLPVKLTLLSHPCCCNCCPGSRRSSQLHWGACNDSAIAHREQRA